MSPTSKNLRDALTPREELIQIQKTLFRKNQKFIEESTLVENPEFKDYQQRYLKQVSRFKKIISFESVAQSLKEIDLIYVGDYHTNRQSQKAFLRLLQLLKSTKPNLLIALELLHEEHQKATNQYLNWEIKEESFLKKIKLHKRWYFDLWENFKPIFEFARMKQIPIYGIEAANHQETSLKQRDLACAQKITHLIKQHPDHCIVVLIGDLHIAAQHLPKEVKSLLKAQNLKKKDALIYQNSEKIYWKLAEIRREHKTEAVQIAKHRFCLINTPPIVWQQSYIDWLEHERKEIDYADAKPTFLELADQIALFLGIKLPAIKEEVEVYTCGDLSFLETLEEDPAFQPEEIRAVKRQILSNESYYIPKRKMVYLASLSLNHAAEEASHFIRHLCAGDEFPRSLADAFYANTLHEALGFLGSKFINLKRKAPQEKQFLKTVLTTENKFGKIPLPHRLEFEIAKGVLEHKTREEQRLLLSSAEVSEQSKLVFFGLTHALGYMLGNDLFEALLAEKFQKRTIKQLFYNPFKQPGEPGRVYLALIQKLSKLGN